MYRKILLAYDGFAFSASALRQGAELARLAGAELHLLGIVVTTGVMALAEGSGGIDVWGRERQFVERALEEAAQDLASQGIKVFTCIREGEPSGEIAAHAHQIGANLVIIGHSDKGFLTRLFEGSIGAQLLSHLPCSLLVATGQS